MKRPRKRFSSEEQIIKAIDKVRAKIEAECKEAEEEDVLADELYKRIGELSVQEKLNDEEQKAYHHAKIMAPECRKRAFLLRRLQGRRQNQMERLKATLASFKTMPMSFLSDDSVVLARL